MWGTEILQDRVRELRTAGRRARYGADAGRQPSRVAELARTMRRAA
ncbi:MAG: hypothetical protein ABR520_06590 [Mycobacteriales bacterium]|nr:hypothetical protein [Frankia sp.]